MDVVLTHVAMFSGAVSLLIFALFFKAIIKRKKAYVWPLTSFVLEQNFVIFSLKPRILFFLRVATLIFAALLAGGICHVKKTQNLFVDGIDIVLTLDLSDSMQLIDDPTHDARSRFDVAKSVALNFIKNRPNDAIAVVGFAQDAITIAPLTLDKNMLEVCLTQTSIGDIDGNNTNIAQSLGLSLARIVDSKAKSKIIILLTDGRPTIQSDITIEKAISIAREKKIKIYTVGVGGTGGGYIRNGSFGYQRVPADGVDQGLLSHISTSTGAKAFLARNPKELVQAYEEIDRLEKSKQQIPFFFNMQQIFWPIAIPLLILILLELLLNFFWRGFW